MQPSYQSPALKKFLPAIVWFVFSFIILCLPGEDLPEMNNWITRLYPDKWIHIFLFGCQVYLLNRPFGRSDFPESKKKHTFVVTGVAVCVWGLITEFIQKYFVPGRGFEIADWGADTLGCFLAFVFSKRLFLR